MANKFKKFFAMLLVMCMLTGMLPVQALAEQEEPALEVIPMEDLKVDVAVDEETNTVVVEFAPVDETVDAPAGEVEWVSGATHDAEIETTVTEIAVSEPVESSSDEPAVEEPAPETTVESTTVIESVTVETNGTLEDGTVVTGEETYTETTTTTTETTTETTVDANGNEVVTETVTETVTVHGVVEGEETAALEDAEITPEDTDLPEVEVPAFNSGELFEGEKDAVVESETKVEDKLEEEVIGSGTFRGEKFDVYDQHYESETTTTEHGTFTEQEKVEEENKTVETTTTTTVDRTTVENFEEDAYEYRYEDGEVIQRDNVFQKTETVVDVTTNVTVTETTTEVTGDVKEDENDLEYDFTTTETTIIRDVTTDVEMKVEDESTFDMEQVIAPEEYEGKNYSGPGVKEGSAFKFDGLLEGTDPNSKNPAAKPEDESYEGYDYVLSGSGDATLAAAPVFMNVVYEKNEDGTPKKDENGNYIIKETSLVYAGDKAGNSGMNGTPSQIVVKNGEGEDAEYFYTYCIDKVTPTADNSWYKITNLEDSDYYPDDESAAMLRAIVTNGYWGTDPSKTETDEEGNVIPNQGSIESVKALLRENYDANATVTVKDAQGNEHTYNVAELIDGLKEHEALAATQAAIWSYSNGSLATQNGQDGVICVGVQSAKKYYNNIDKDPSPLNQYGPVYNLESDARLKALYDCFMNLDPVAATPENTTTVINEQNFLKDVNLNVGDKVEDREEVNEETGETVEKDVYETELEFTLAFVVDDEDNLTVVLLKDGQPVMEKHLAQTNEDGDENTIVPDENGVYTLSGLQLSENEKFNFDLQLKGTQVLEEGVYVYTSHGGTGHSQTLVGLAAGTQNVNVSASMTIEFNVDESKNVVATRQWRTESDPVTSTTTTTKNPTGKDVPPPPAEEEEVPEPPVVYRMARGVGQLETIIDEEVPLAEVPQTGDNSIVWFALILMSVCGLCVLNLSDKKCKA